jgi:tagaturonate reductase
MQLSRKNISSIVARGGITAPQDAVFQLPEKVLQFGTGVLLRGLPDYFIDKANRKGIFNGRIVVVKSTANGGTDAFATQDGLFTQFVKGIEDGKKIEEVIINSSISRVLSANDDWAAILAFASSRELELVISNTTEVGISYVEESIFQKPPASFPAKLLAVLYERYNSKQQGLVIVPTELVNENGTQLREIVLKLAAFNKLETEFVSWLQNDNDFCNTLVDRIVPGKPSAADMNQLESKYGYTDELAILSESFSLWAIESGSQRVKNKLTFAGADSGMVIAADIHKFKELKLRLLNGTHTFSCALAFLAGFDTVKDAMNDERFSSFVSQLITQETAAAIAEENITYKEACDFAAKVLDRFRNPALDHRWLSISVQYSLKMKMRNIPLLLRHYQNSSQVPECMALGFAAFLLFMKSTSVDGKTFTAINGAKNYPVQDEFASKLSAYWNDHGVDGVAAAVFADKSIWGTDLNKLTGFANAVNEQLHILIDRGANAALNELQFIKAAV